MLLLRALSWIWPMRVERVAGRYADLELAWEYGRLVVNTPNANQSGGSLLRIWRYTLQEPELKAVRPRSVLMLGFGTGSAAQVLRRVRKIDAPITGVDGSPEMLDLARMRFHVEQWAQPLRLVQADAFAFLAACTDRFDLVLVDLFHDLDLAPGVEDPAFLAHLRRCTAPDGVLCFNTIDQDALGGARSERVHQGLRHLFGRVEERRYQGINRVFIAR